MTVTIISDQPINIFSISIIVLVSPIGKNACVVMCMHHTVADRDTIIFFIRLHEYYGRNNLIVLCERFLTVTK